ncbi:hypothetical protein [Cochleicola gelatinilyticus]|uniref:Uncharacterized protein n=1 Tax=Cochleicola gelatinilyticus TaxID=1763537 RepID=A0A167IKF2_9FLAO|nr:hypothetical protein [Cochleicola gelatinilyticus]OAB79745.1 hypothetical protein ULVI_03090 [Cochleicola gelatinilyticus]
MAFPTGKFNTRFFTDKNNTIEMKKWVTPTLNNIGTTSVFINDQEVEPKGFFEFGPQGVAITGSISLRFEGTGKSRIAMNYVMIDEPKKCN